MVVDPLVQRLANKLVNCKGSLKTSECKIDIKGASQFFSLYL